MIRFRSIWMCSLAVASLTIGFTTHAQPEEENAGISTNLTAAEVHLRLPEMAVYATRVDDDTLLIYGGVTNTLSYPDNVFDMFGAGILGEGLDYDEVVVEGIAPHWIRGVVTGLRDATPESRLRVEAWVLRPKRITGPVVESMMLFGEVALGEALPAPEWIRKRWEPLAIGEEAIQAAIESLADDQFSVRKAAKDRLKASGPMAREALEDLGEDTDPEIREAVKQILSSLPAPRWTTVIQAVERELPALRDAP